MIKTDVVPKELHLNNTKDDRNKSRAAAIAEEANRKRSEAMIGVPYAGEGEQRKENVVVHDEPLHSQDSHASRKAAASEAHVHPSTLAKVQALPTEYREQLASGAEPDTLPNPHQTRIHGHYGHKKAGQDVPAGAVFSRSLRV